MRDMRPGAVVPEDPDRALVVETEIRKYNRRFSGEPRSFLEKMYDLPGLLRHFWRNFTVTEGLGLLFHGRIIIMISAFILYFLMPFDLLPESLLGVFGLVDDLAAFGILAAQVAAMWRAFIVREDAAPARNQHRPPHSDRREGFRAQ
jgi:RING finger protein 170